MANAKNSWTNAKSNSTRPDVAALRDRARARIDEPLFRTFTVESAEAIANINTETDSDGWSYIAVPAANAEASGYTRRPRTDSGGEWAIVVMDEAGEVVGFM